MHHYAAPLLQQEIGDVQMSGSKSAQAEDVLAYFYYGALVGIALNDYEAVRPQQTREEAAS